MAKAKSKKTNKNAKKEIKDVKVEENKDVVIKDIKEEKAEEQKKEAKKEKVKKEKKEKVKKEKKKSIISKNDSEITKLIKIVLIVTAIMVLFYGITIIVTKNKTEKENINNGTSEKAVIQYDNIMIGTMLNKDHDKYYVLIEEEDDNRIVEYQTYMKLIGAKDDAPKIYTANLVDSFNSKYLAKEANDSSNMEEFRVTGTTLVKIKDGKIDKVYPDYEAIKKELESLSK